MEQDAVEGMMEAVKVSRRRKRAIARELRTHLEECRRELETAGWPPADAERESLARFGDPNEIGGAFSQVYAGRRRAPIALVVGLSSALIMGMFSVGGSLASTATAHHAPVRTHATHGHTSTPRTTVRRHR